MLAPQTALSVGSEEVLARVTVPIHSNTYALIALHWSSLAACALDCAAVLDELQLARETNQSFSRRQATTQPCWWCDVLNWQYLN